jgi:hypothetical protein
MVDKLHLVGEQASEQAEQAPPPNPFDPERLRISLDFDEGVGVKKAILTIPVRKPNAQNFVRVREEPEYRLPVAVIELKDEREWYLVTPEVAQHIPGECFKVVIYTCMSRSGVLFLWPVRLPGADGRQSEWHRSAAEAAEMGMKRWIRVKANMDLGAYEVFEASAAIPDPVWPSGLTLMQTLMIGFKGRLVDSLDHPVLKRLRGET